MRAHFRIRKPEDTGGIEAIIYDVGSGWEFLYLYFRLIFRYGFLPLGIYVPGIFDDAMYPTLRRERLKVICGWSNWEGYYLSAVDVKSAEFLQRFYHSR